MCGVSSFLSVCMGSPAVVGLARCPCRLPAEGCANCWQLPCPWGPCAKAGDAGGGGARTSPPSWERLSATHTPKATGPVGMIQGHHCMILRSLPSVKSPYHVRLHVPNPRIRIRRGLSGGHHPAPLPTFHGLFCTILLRYNYRSTGIQRMTRSSPCGGLPAQCQAHVIDTPPP